MQTCVFVNHERLKHLIAKQRAQESTFLQRLSAILLQSERKAACILKAVRELMLCV